MTKSERNTTLCKYCHGESDQLLYNRMRTAITQFDGETGEVVVSIFPDDTFMDRSLKAIGQFNFCPICGRRVGKRSNIDRFYDRLKVLYPNFKNFEGAMSTIAWRIAKDRTGLSYMDDGELLKKLKEKYS